MRSDENTARARRSRTQTPFRLLDVPIFEQPDDKSAGGDYVMASRQPAIDPQIVCARGIPAVDADMERIRQFANIYAATMQAQTLTKEVPLRDIAELQHNLLNAGAFGDPCGRRWDDLDETEQRQATRAVYTALVATIVAGFHVTPAVPYADETSLEQPGYDGGQRNGQDRRTGAAP